MRAKTRRLFLIAVIAAFLVALLPPVVPPAAAAPCSGPSGGGKPQAHDVLKHGPSARNGMETVALKTFYLEVKVPKKKYRIGQTVKIPVEVTRPSDEDPLGNGIPTPRPYVMPAEDVSVGVGLIINDVYLPGFGLTDEEGKVTISVRIERWARPGTVNASFYAWKVLADVPCFRFEEWGFKPVPGAFKVTR